MRNALRFGVTTAALAAAACASSRESELREDAGAAAYDATSTTPVVLEVGPDADPSRVYFYDPSDFAHVYWYDVSRPDAWEYRTVFRDGGRAYFLDKDAVGVVRRFYFDDARARQFDWTTRWTAAQRDAIGLNARIAWAQRQHDQGAGITDVTVQHDVVVDLEPDAFPGRTFFLDPADEAHVYWFDASSPGHWTYRPFYREGGRVYVVERSGTTLQRLYFDEKRARHIDWNGVARWDAAERDALRAEAREAWLRRAPTEAEWRASWEQRLRDEESAALARDRLDRAAQVDLNAVIDVQSDAYPERTYFYDPADTTHVYWFDASSPGAWTYRPYYRDGDRTYVLEPVGASLQRVYFDDARAKAFDLSKDTRWNVAQRGTLRTTAREEWARRQRDETAWRGEWDRRLRRGDVNASRGSDAGPRVTEVVDLDSVPDVDADTIATRRFFYEPDDTTHVFWFDTSDPGTWNYRPVYRVGARAYFLDRDDAGAVRRFTFDDARARRFDWRRESRWDDAQRARLRESARAAWSRREADESGWRGRWDERHRGDRR